MLIVYFVNTTSKRLMPNLKNIAETGLNNMISQKGVTTGCVLLQL